MISERDIFRTALAMIQRHRRQAAAIAAEQADELARAGDARSATWLRIAATVNLLSATEPQAGQLHH